MAKRLSAEERRASIIKVAKRLFAQNGFNGVSIDEIVREVGVSPAILYRHFESKDELYVAVLQEFSATRESYIDAVIADDNGFEQVLRCMTSVFVSSIMNHPDLLKMEMHSQLENLDASHDFFFNRWKSFTDYIEFNLTELQSQKKIYPINAKAAALIYQGIIREVLLQKCMQLNDQFQDTPVAILVDDVITLFMRIIEPKKM